MQPLASHGRDRINVNHNLKLEAPLFYNSTVILVLVQAEKPNSARKATDGLQEPSDSGPTTPLPDKKLLDFILDRLQKKDTYGVFAEPVDPDELPDYHDIIKHPMDFATVRKKLSAGAYANLEQFENDVFLISSNAMCYNSPDTIYYRQARAIQELAKKDFENLRQETDDEEPETKPRRGRPPSKIVAKQKVGKPAELASSGFSSDVMLANAVSNGHLTCMGHDFSRKTNCPDTHKPYALRKIETHSWSNEHKSEKNEDCSVKGVSKYWKKVSPIDEYRRNTYKQPQSLNSLEELSTLSTFHGERKQLVPVGLHTQYVYAHSLARFAAKLGPIGWEIAAKRIERVLPPGIKFGRGWVGENDLHQQPQTAILTASPHSSPQPKITASPLCTTTVSAVVPSSKSVAAEGHSSVSLPMPALESTAQNSSTDSMRGFDSIAAVSQESGLKLHIVSGATGQGIQQKNNFQLYEPAINGLNTTIGFNMSSRTGKVDFPSRPPGSFILQAKTSHSPTVDMCSRSNDNHISHVTLGDSDVSKAKVVGNSSFSSSSTYLPPDIGCNQQGLRRGLPQHSKTLSLPPDLNIRFQTPLSPTSSMAVDPQQPDLALQL
ncbi:uncharacterized protein [Typha angustifolia]|uniref:uncharacterized protein isoform X2 n=1 Tax=Typha angustifolia TaxID=59011 RepID=UPI003C3019C2